ncbi:P-aminobenzoyl-glutamate transporter [Kocuria sp. WRN011]|uniref:AbgT family transporter n=1 Tax=Kocuria sp. WRN011 TaxID=2029858 RepID=UPI000BB067C5|nr:AbgT family transporter [Kocuria sp. WRN011]PBB08980.1 P-aminobenzoyl-glutamate transporter [Kocuria sp. WRN011]
MSSAPVDTVERSVTDRVLGGIERIGNKIPEPFILFVLLLVVTAIATTVMAWLGVSVQVPGSDEVTQIRGFFTGEGLTWFTANLGANFIGFPPLAVVLPIIFGVGLAEKTGLLAAMIRWAFGSAPRWALPYAVALVGVLGSIMSDAAFVVIPPLAALVFKAAGRHPVAGLLGGFAAAGAGYSTTMLVTSLDALFAGITTAVAATLPDPGTPVTPISNYFFNVASSVVLTVAAGFLIDKVLEPRIDRAGISRDQVVKEEDEHAQNSAMSAVLEPQEKRGVRWALVAGLAVMVLFMAAALVPASPWRNETGSFLPRSPLLDSIVFIVFALFSVIGIVYGRVVGTIRTWQDVPNIMGEALRDMLSFVVLAFILGQFIALFNWSGIGSWIAVSGANGLEAIGLTGFPAILGFILLASVLNLFIISGSSMWTLMGAVFVPMFALLGYEPAFVQGAFRVGDSATQILTPMNPYMIVLLTMLRRYEPEAGLGTVIARMLPFTLVFWILWVGVLAVFYGFDLPMGPGNDIFINE